MTEGLLWCITYFCMAAIAYKYSMKVFIIICIYFFYHVFDQILFAYDYKRGYMTYWALLSISLSVLVVIFWPMKKKAIYRAME